MKNMKGVYWKIKIKKGFPPQRRGEGTNVYGIPVWSAFSRDQVGNPKSRCVEQEEDRGIPRICGESHLLDLGHSHDPSRRPDHKDRPAYADGIGQKHPAFLIQNEFGLQHRRGNRDVIDHSRHETDAKGSCPSRDDFIENSDLREQADLFQSPDHEQDAHKEEQRVELDVLDVFQHVEFLLRLALFLRDEQEHQGQARQKHQNRRQMEEHMTPEDGRDRQSEQDGNLGIQSVQFLFFFRDLKDLVHPAREEKVKREGREQCRHIEPKELAHVDLAGNKDHERRHVARDQGKTTSVGSPDHQNPETDFRIRSCLRHHRQDDGQSNERGRQIVGHPREEERKSPHDGQKLLFPESRGEKFQDYVFDPASLIQICHESHGTDEEQPEDRNFEHILMECVLEVCFPENAPLDEEHDPCGEAEEHRTLEFLKSEFFLHDDGCKGQNKEEQNNHLGNHTLSPFKSCCTFI